MKKSHKTSCFQLILSLSDIIGPPIVQDSAEVQFSIVKIAYNAEARWSAILLDVRFGANKHGKQEITGVLVDRNKYTIVCSISSKMISGSVVEQTYTRTTTAILAEMLSIVIIDLNDSHAISLLADVEGEMLLVFMNGRKIARHLLRLINCSTWYQRICADWERPKKSSRRLFVRKVDVG
jgi:hypothetical protein